MPWIWFSEYVICMGGHTSGSKSFRLSCTSTQPWPPPQDEYIMPALTSGTWHSWIFCSLGWQCPAHQWSVYKLCFLKSVLHDMLIGVPWGIKLSHGKISLGNSGLSNVKNLYYSSEPLIWLHTWSICKRTILCAFPKIVCPEILLSINN